MKKILVYSHDTFGLGNIRRMLVIVQKIAESIEAVSILAVSGASMILLESPNSQCLATGVEVRLE